ncbi:DUF3108 domain-containing protein [Amphritea balenae]|uniref:DUF3108 domain-containing protein n=1 Tax=Amphritea balenae TaxID=452629 RepID=A0A3P1STQ6_9GAMM|nr:DUF3108 domain-containing protein [Amphritea balenae]RRD00582.1 DUF3108 domain-containing protein [Amphritea balenae]GGK69593.1 hypothetical protein GCM10007941_19710 [Amphritea balenae]
MRFSALLTALLMLFALPGQAAEGLKPYQATYKAQFDLGFSFSGKAVRELRKNGDQWVLSMNAKALFASINEFTQFKINNDLIEPQRYEYHRKVIGSSKDAVLQFNWSTGTVLNDIKGKPWTMDVPKGALDSLTYQVQLRQDLLANKEQFVYEVADGGRLKTYRFIRLGTEPIATPLGSFNAVKIQRDRGPDSKRQSYIWCAPELDYIVVKLQQVEKNGKEYSLLIDELKMTEAP